MMSLEFHGQNFDNSVSDLPLFKVTAARRIIKNPFMEFQNVQVCGQISCVLVP
jgi:hypothetical protein